MAAGSDFRWNDEDQAWIAEIATPNLRTMMLIRTGSREHPPSAEFCSTALARVAKLDRIDQQARAYLADKAQTYVFDKYRHVARPGLFALLAVEMHVQAPVNEYALCYSADWDPNRLWRVTVRGTTPQNWTCIPWLGTTYSSQGQARTQGR